MELLSKEDLRKFCPVKWHENIPKDGISLGVADVDFKGPEGALAFVKNGLREEFSFYQDQSGLEPAVNAAHNYLKNKNIDLSPKNIQVIDGTMMGIYISMKWISQKPGDLLVLGPLYDPIHRHATSTGNTLHWSEIDSEGIDEEDIKHKVSSQEIKMITMCNPVNPLGHVFSEEELSFIADIAIDNDLFVFADELYEPLWFDKPHRSIASFDGLQERSLMLYGFSKAYGLAGYRAGFMHIGPEVENVKYIASQQMVSPSPVASLVTEYALTDERSRNWVQEFRKHCQLITNFAAKQFNDKGYNCNIPESCFFIYPDLEVDDEKFTEFLLTHYGTQVVPGNRFGPGGEGHIRINCATSTERLQNGLSRIFDALNEFDKVKN